MGLDVIIIGRGGGSIEDLYCYNDERIAYAIYNAKTPIISAVGHEINDSISDLVADLRVATPTAAGEAATFDYDEFINDIENYRLTLDNVIDGKVTYIKTKLDSAREKLTLLAPRARVLRYKEKIKSCDERLKFVMKNRLLVAKQTLSHYVDVLKASNVLDKLSNGLLYTTDKNNKKITSISQVKKDDIIKQRLVDGRLTSKVVSIEKI